MPPTALPPVLQRPLECRTCPLDSEVPGTQGFMTMEGSGSLGVLACAEALGEHEAHDGLPLRPQAPAGGVFDRSVRRAGLSRDQLAITNLIHCRPPRNLLEHQWYEPDAVHHCKVHMDREMERVRPRVIFAMGNLPLKYLAGYSGEKRTITFVRGFYLDGIRYPGIPVIATYHPSYIQRDKPNLLGVFRLDLLRAVALAKAGPVCRPTKRYAAFPSLPEAERFLGLCYQRPDSPIMYDIETVESISGTDESVLKVRADGTLQVQRVSEEYADSPEHLIPQDNGGGSMGAGIAIGGDGCGGAGPTTVEYYEDVPKHRTRITQIQFSLEADGSAIILPWHSDYLAVIHRIMGTTRNPKWGWNSWGYDDPLLMQEGVRFQGVSHDLMWAWHHLQPDLPRGLQYACSFFIPEALPWKHRSVEDPGEYGGDDVAYPRKFGEDILRALDQRGLRRAYERHVVHLQPMLNINSLGWPSAAGRGIPVDDDRRVALGEDMDRLRAQVDVELQGVYPDELRGLSPEEGYKNPKLAEKAKAGPGQGLKEGEKWAEREFPAPPAKPVKDAEQPPAQVAMDLESEVIPATLATPAIPATPATPATVLRWVKLKPFLPNSGQQILKYIKWARAREIQDRMTTRKQSRDVAERNALYVVPKKFREDKETTEKKEILRLASRTKDSFFDKVIEHREYGKMRATYVNGWAPRPQTGCVHTTFLFVPATGQLSSRGPNCQNLIKGGDVETPAAARKTAMAKQCRAMIRPKPGFRLVEADMTAFHALTLGFEARDADYMRLARLDIHSFVAANILWMNNRQLILDLKLPPNPSEWFKYPDEELAAILKVVKKSHKVVRDKRAKPGILGIGFGLGYRKLFDMNKRDELNPKGMESQAEAKKIMDIIKGLFPKVFVYQDETRELAHRQSNLVSAHGYQRWFFDVYHWDAKRAGLIPGKDSEAAIAFRPANNAFGMIKEQMLELDGWPGWGATAEEMQAEVDRRAGWGLADWMAGSRMCRYGFINQIHDSLVFHCQDRLVEECLDSVERVMTGRSQVLVDPVVAPEGLMCGIEVGVSPVGGDWSTMETVRVVMGRR